MPFCALLGVGVVLLPTVWVFHVVSGVNKLGPHRTSSGRDEPSRFRNTFSRRWGRRACRVRGEAHRQHAEKPHRLGVTRILKFGFKEYVDSFGGCGSRTGPPGVVDLEESVTS
ncbi:hypothetical protein TNCT_630941 [Trichonephila clavata]|uniref:Secreted protein n=1 Tax=Trichonephila clavata TaxID=2740835 RepID=A0A8X6L6V2_TRICU|nr:hypothetical protein TNCT_630941 [Trichonephila clavata]